jgi:hypothetical protein
MFHSRSIQYQLREGFEIIPNKIIVLTRHNKERTPHTRARELAFHGGFYGLRNFGCKTAQLSETPRESLWL